jgi:hypothetical protein
MAGRRRAGTSEAGPAIEAREDTRKPFSAEAFFESVELMRKFARLRPIFVLEELPEHAREVRFL